VAIYSFLQNPADDVFLLVHEDVQIAVVTGNRYFVLFDYAIDSRSNRWVLTLSHPSVTNGIPFSEQALKETPGAPIVLAEIPTDATVVALIRYSAVQATIHSQQQMTASRPSRTHLSNCHRCLLNSPDLRVAYRITSLPIGPCLRETQSVCACRCYRVGSCLRGYP
jgi:hypothetical protein